MHQIYFSNSVFAARRASFFKKISSGVAVLFSAPAGHGMIRSYRTSSNFYYLTGYREEGAAAIFQPGSAEPFRLFVEPRNAERELWDGKRYGVEKAKEVFGADACYPLEEFENVLRKVLGKTSDLYYPMGEFPEIDDKMQAFLATYVPNARAGERSLRTLHKVQDVVAEMRQIKDSAEIDLMRKNCKNSALAHVTTMRSARPGMYEYQFQAIIEAEFKKGGAEDEAYGSIVAGGNNACILHYKTNRDQIKDGELVLIDAGGETGCFSSDITRTFPINGKFSPAQAKIYQIVLDAQKKGIAMSKPGVKFMDVHVDTTRVLMEGLHKLGLLKESVDAVMKDQKKIQAFYPHRTGHWLGLDTHDVGNYMTDEGESLALRAGMVMTVEPGLYIDKDRTDVPAEYRGIGIRIEDDVLITESGTEVLTKDVPKEIAELEAIVGKNA